ncbi:hypothetical protein H009_17958 [Agrobacterium tumefaciens str. Cherry 2E-2-2]|uniref:Uncharacterized protein n=2 Tax=Agrobacterium TaxID=357 RepID=A0A1S7R6Q6_9HYPH|nr:MULTISPECIES: hypothetical protein [Agrobacterium]EMS96372.1 hypothetical protein H009_17958 [Agrobacterium tumefaciens str. Cherry 2E-2-2]AYM82181.1 hypothetical protein At12D1_22940 [Agrobacterium tumefaciens]NTE90311.1 hypothetical protein [Agrobacterium tumefaciens]CUX18217.1 conserved membrane hypothetical protein [Agrobacterium tumefaciens str. Kerr 14]CUX47814.1 conserved membrane hypothetical protein [Agrobacterium deltaense Zutra 3/1]
MIPLLMIAVALIGATCVAAYALATYALPVMIAIAAARVAYSTGAGLIGAGIIGLIVGVASFRLLACLSVTLRSPTLRLAVALVFTIPAAIAGYALVYGVTREAIPSELWRQVFCMAGGVCTGMSALARLANHPSSGGG